MGGWIVDGLLMDCGLIVDGLLRDLDWIDLDLIYEC
jgi:hypothetical protein